MEQEFELKIEDVNGISKIVTWYGKSGEDAARRYADSHRGAIVFAWRYPRFIIQHGVQPTKIIG